MAYEIIREYTSLLQRKADIESALTDLPKGYISKKNIKGITYHYLQARVNGHMKSIYLKADEVAETAKKLSLRKKYESELPTLENRLNELEQAAALIHSSLARKLEMLKLSVGMDELSEDRKELCVSFSEAMTSIEGIPASAETKRDLQNWMDGTVSFLSVFESTLKRYGFPMEGNG